MKKFLVLFSAICALHADNTAEQLRNTTHVASFVVIGAGPAGYAAAMQAARLGLDVVLFEGPQPGGQLTETGIVENWPGIVRATGSEIMQAQRRQVINHGVTVVGQTVTQLALDSWPFAIQTDDGTTMHALSVLIATGSEPRKLGVPGEAEFWGSGVSACALCDGPLFKNKDIVVVGGGDSALEEVMQLASYVKHITLLVRSNQMRASQIMQEKVQQMANVTIKYNAHIQAIVGTMDEGVTSVEVVCNDQHELISVSGIFLAIGHLPRTDLVKKQLSCDNSGCITVSGQSQATSMPGVFAAGDVIKNNYRQAGVAAGEGQKAAQDAYEFLQSRGLTPSELKALRTGTKHIDGLTFFQQASAVN